MTTRSLFCIITREKRGDLGTTCLLFASQTCSFLLPSSPFHSLVPLPRSCSPFQLLFLLSVQLQDTVLEKRDERRERERERELSFVSSCTLPLCPQKLIGRKLDVSLRNKVAKRTVLFLPDKTRSIFVLARPGASLRSPPGIFRRDALFAPFPAGSCLSSVNFTTIIILPAGK